MLDRIEHQLGRVEDDLSEVMPFLRSLKRKVDKMAVNQAEFDSVLATFLADIDAAITALSEKIPAEVDLSTELGQINDAKARLEAALTPAAPVVEPPAEPTA